MVALSMRSVQVDSKPINEYFRRRRVVFTPANVLSAKFMTAIRLGPISIRRRGRVSPRSALPPAGDFRVIPRIGLFHDAEKERGTKI
jgi:hypothetical protein